MEVYFGGAEEMEITEEEMAAVRAIVMAVSAGRIYFQSKVVLEKIGATGSGEDDDECKPGCCD